MSRNELIEQLLDRQRVDYRALRRFDVDAAVALRRDEFSLAHLLDALAQMFAAGQLEIDVPWMRALVPAAPRAVAYLPQAAVVVALASPEPD